MGRLALADNELDSELAELVSPDGFLPDGRGYFDFSAELGTQPLDSGMATATRVVRFRNLTNERFPISLTPLGLTSDRLGVFSSKPLVNVKAGEVYRYTALRGRR